MQNKITLTGRSNERLWCHNAIRSTEQIKPMHLIRLSFKFMCARNAAPHSRTSPLDVMLLIPQI